MPRLQVGTIDAIKLLVLMVVFVFSIAYFNATEPVPHFIEPFDVKFFHFLALGLIILSVIVAAFILLDIFLLSRDPPGGYP